MEKSSKKTYFLLTGLYIFAAIILRLLIGNYFSGILYLMFLPVITLIPILFYFLIGLGLVNNSIKGLIIVSAAVILSQLIWPSSFDMLFAYKMIAIIVGGFICIPSVYKK